MKNILLPTDFSKNSINAIKYAVNLFEDIECSFYILNVQKASSFISDDLMSVSTSATIYNTLVDAAKKSITNIILQINKNFKNENHTFHSIVDYDNFIDAINQTSKIHGIDLIIMGTKGASGIEKVVFGSNTVHVLQRCDLPVLVIPEGCKFKKWDTVAFASSFRSTYLLNDLIPLQELVLLCHSKLKILHVVEDYNFEERRNENVEFFESNFPQVVFERIMPNDKNIYNVVHEYIVKNEVKMIAMVGKKHAFLSKLFTRHSVETWAFNIDIPFLVMHGSKAHS